MIPLLAIAHRSKDMIHFLVKSPRSLNEFPSCSPSRRIASVLGMIDVDDAANIAVHERYTYTFGISMEELDHPNHCLTAARSKD